jgi:hypothetical protein
MLEKEIKEQTNSDKIIFYIFKKLNAQFIKNILIIIYLTNTQNLT